MSTSNTLYHNLKLQNILYVNDNKASTNSHPKNGYRGMLLLHCRSHTMLTVLLVRFVFNSIAEKKLSQRVINPVSVYCVSVCQTKPALTFKTIK